MNILLVRARCDKIVSVVEILVIFNCASEQMWQISNTYLLNNPNSITVHNHQLFYICKQISHEATTLILNLHESTNENFHNFRSFGQPIKLTIAEDPLFQQLDGHHLFQPMYTMQNPDFPQTTRGNTSKKK
jgi:hypothetical protein